MVQDTVTEYDYVWQEPGKLSYVRFAKKDMEGKDILGGIFTYTYEDGRLVKADLSQASYRSWGMTLAQPIVRENVYRYAYDESGNLLSAEAYEDGEMQRRTEYEYEYDAKGNLVEKRETVMSAGEKRIYRYDGDGKPLYGAVYTVKGETELLQREWEYSYDSHGRETSIKQVSHEYEANEDYSKVNELRAVTEEIYFHYRYTYYTEAEWEEYRHDSEYTNHIG